MNPKIALCSVRSPVRTRPRLLTRSPARASAVRGRRSSSACAKNADSFRRISFARFSSRTTRSSSLIRCFSSVVSPPRRPVSRSACRTHFRNVSALQPIFDAIEAIALHWESHSLWCSNTIRTARSRTSGEYLIGLPMMTPILSSNGVSGKPGAVQPLTVSAEYMGVTDKKFKKEFVIDFAAFDNLTWAGTAPLQTIAKSIEALQKSIGNLSNGMKKLSVLVYSQDDLDAESTAWNLSRKLRRVSPDGRNEIENLIDHEISRLSTKPVPPLQSGEGE